MRLQGQIIAALNVQSKKWKLGKVVLDHNHALSSTKSYFPTHKYKDMNTRRKLLLQVGVLVSQNVKSVIVNGGGYNNVTYTDRDCRNVIQVQQSDMNHADGDAEALIKGANTYQNTHENSNISILNRVYNTLFNQSTTTKEPNLCNCRLRL